MKIENIGHYIDHTNLKAEALPQEIIKLCEEAKEYSFKAVCINPCYVALATEILKGSEVEICTVVGFPLGATLSEVKGFEAKKAVEDGATEVDMVVNIGRLKAGDIDFVVKDIGQVVKAVSGRACVKVILECCLLSENEKVNGCLAALEAGADYVKTSTGFSTGGATVEDVLLMKKTVGHKMKIKAAGGIRTYEVATKMLEAGASRVGASAGISIVKEGKGGVE